MSNKTVYVCWCRRNGKTKFYTEYVNALIEAGYDVQLVEPKCDPNQRDHGLQLYLYSMFNHDALSQYKMAAISQMLEEMLNKEEKPDDATN